MSIPLPPSPRAPGDIHWMLQRAPTGGWLSSQECAWDDIALPVELDPGFSVFRTRHPMLTMYLGLSGSDLIYHLASRGPTEYFSFVRNARRMAPSGSEKIWLYSLFGYIEERQIVCVRYRPTREMELLVLPRPVVFPW